VPEQGRSTGSCARQNESGTKFQVKPLDENERLLALQVALKCADISHLAMPLELHKRWLLALEEEVRVTVGQQSARKPAATFFSFDCTQFFRQGDEEAALGLPISPLFDRCKPGCSSSQVGFLEVVAMPLFQVFVSAFPGTQPLATGVQATQVSCC
jgi:hypothetical protein